MSTAAVPAPSRRRWRWLLSRLALALALVLALLAGVWATRARWLAPWLVEQAEQRLGDLTGAELRLGTLGGDWLRTIELSDIDWRDDRDDAVLREARVRLVRARWDPWKALRGQPDWLVAVELEGLRVRARVRGGDDREGAAGEPFELPARLPSVDVRDVELELELEAGTLALAQARLALAPPGEARQPLQIEAGRLSWQAQVGPSVAGRLEADLAWSAPRLEIGSLRLDGVERVRSSWVDLSGVARDAVAWDARLAVLEGDLRAEGTWREGTLDVDVELESVALEPALRIALGEEDELPRAALTGRGSLHLEEGRPEALRASFEGRAAEVVLAGRAIEEIDGQVALEGGVLTVGRLLARRGSGRLEARDVALPLGLDLLETLRAARGSVDLQATDLPAWLGTPPPPGSLVSRAPAHTLTLGLRLTETGLALERGQLTTFGGTAAVRPSSIVWGPPGRMLEEAYLDVDLDLDFRDLSDLGPVLASDRRWGGSLRGSLALDGTWGSVVGGLDVEGLDVVAGGLELGELRAVADVDAERVQVAEFRADGALGRLALEGTWILADQRFEQASLQAATSAPQVWLPDLFARGTIEVQARASGSPLDPQGRFEVHATDLELVPLPGRPLERLALIARLEPGAVAVEELALESMGLALAGRGELQHAGWQAPFELRLDALSARLDELDLALVESAHVLIGASSVETGPLRLAGSAGELDGELEWRQGDLSLQLAARRLDPMPVLAPLVPAGFDLQGVQGELALELVDGALAGRGRLDVARLVPAQGLAELRGGLSGVLQDGRVVLERFEIESDRGQALSLAGEAPLDLLGATLLPDGPLDLRGSARVDELGVLPLGLGDSRLALTGALSTDFTLRGSWERLAGEASLGGRDLALTSNNGTALLGPAALTARLDVGESTLVLRELALDAPGQAQISGSGLLQSGLVPRRWMEDGPGELLAAPLTLDLQLVAADLAFLARLSPAIRRVSGHLSGDIGLSGSLADPSPRARLDIVDGDLRLAGDIPSIAALRARLELEPGALELVHLRGEMGGGPVEGDGRLDWSGAAPRVTLALRGDEVLLVQQPTLRVRADVDLAVEGPLDALAVSGRLGLREGRYSKRIDLFGRGPATRAAPGPPLRLFSFEEGPLARMQLDLEVVSVEPFRVENNLVRGSVRADLRLTGSGEDPALVGALFVDPTRVNLPATTMQTTSGTLVFSRQDPLMPRLDVRLETRVRSFEIQAWATGPLADPQLELTSIPPLPSEDLLVLVLTGKPPDQSWDARAGEQAAQTVAFFVGKDLLQEWVSDPGADPSDSWLDRVEYRTGVDVTISGKETSEFSLRIVGEPTGTGRTVWLRAESDAYDRINYGVRMLLRLK